MLNYTLIVYNNEQIINPHLTLRRPRFLPPLLTLLLIACSTANAQSKDELERVDQTLKATQKTLKKNTQQRQKTQNTIHDLEKQIAERAQRYELTKLKNNDLEMQARSYSAEQKELANKFAKEKLKLAQLIQSTYLMGQQSGLKIALSQQGAQHFSRLNHYAKDISKARNSQLNTINTLRKHLTSKQTQLDQKQLQLSKLADVLSEDQRYLNQLKVNRLAMIEKLDAAITDGANELTQLRQRKQRLEKVLAEISKRQKARAKRKQLERNNQSAIKRPKTTNRAIISRSGSMPMPVNNVKIVAQFGDKRSNSGLPWSGVLLQGQAGSEIRAIHNGEVVYADWLKGYGLLVIIDHGNNLMSLYGHNRSIHKAVGDQVLQSDIIATMGDTAGLRKAALYFEIRKNGQAENPLKWCKA